MLSVLTRFSSSTNAVCGPDPAAGTAGSDPASHSAGQWCRTAFSEPAPVSERTSISAYFSSLRLLAGHGAQPAEEEGQRDRDDAGVVQREPGEIDAVQHRQAASGRRIVRLPRDDGREDDQHDTGDEAAVHAPQRASRVEPLPEQRVQNRRQVRRCCDREGQRHQECDVLAQRDDAADDRHYADDNRGDPRDPHLLALVQLGLAVHDVGIDVVRERRRRSDRQSSDDREDRRERHRSDDPSRIVPPSSNASSGAAEFALPGAATIVSRPTNAAAPYPRTSVNR